MSVAIDVRDLLGQPGASRTVHLEEPVPGLATVLASVPGGLDGDLLFESVVEGILVTGRSRGPWPWSVPGACRPWRRRSPSRSRSCSCPKRRPRTTSIPSPRLGRPRADAP